jgi:hypothetical protein
MARRITTLLVAAAVAVAFPAAAGADGDPASDVLLGANVFYPYSPVVSPSIEEALNTETAAAAKAGFPVKVALIAAPTDLGVVPSLFGQPQRYADFLEQEISFLSKRHLLVVMAAGYGTQGLSRPAAAAVTRLPPPAGKPTDDLARAAISAVAKITAAEGHPLQNVPGVTKTSSGGSSTGLILGLAAAAVLIAAAAAALTLKRRRTQSQR